MAGLQDISPMVAKRCVTSAVRAPMRAAAAAASQPAWPPPTTITSKAEDDMNLNLGPESGPQPIRSGPAPEERPAMKPRPAWLDGAGPALRSETYETARLRHPGYDIYFVEGEWRGWASGKEPARDPDRAFLAFFRQYAEAHPL